jgi:hypothetical protein
MNVTELMSELVLQIGIILFAVRLGGRLVKKIGIPVSEILDDYPLLKEIHIQAALAFAA